MLFEVHLRVMLVDFGQGYSAISHQSHHHHLSLLRFDNQHSFTTDVAIFVVEVTKMSNY